MSEDENFLGQYSVLFAVNHSGSSGDEPLRLTASLARPA
jgi:hypothetical protein